LAEDIFEFLIGISDVESHVSFLVLFTENKPESRGGGIYASVLNSTSLKSPEDSYTSNVTYSYDPDGSVRFLTSATQPEGAEIVLLQYLLAAIQTVYPRP
jgi:predicted outer membrane repeat protein